MRVVLDTNVLLSALLSPHGTSDMIYRAWRAATFDLVTSVLQLDELRRASRYPKFKTILQPSRVGTMVNNLQCAIVLNHLIIDIETHDPNDAFLLSMSVQGNADYLVTGDHRAGLIKRKKINRTRILTPTLFCLEVLKQNIPVKNKTALQQVKKGLQDSAAGRIKSRGNLNHKK